MRGVFAMSIWAHNAIPLDEWKYRNLKRVLFPVVDFVFLLSGVSAGYYGVPAISEFFPRYIVDSGATLLLVSGFISFLGVAFPRMWPFEIIARSIILGLLVGYFVALFLLTQAGEGNRGFILGLSIIPIALTVWRLSLLGSEWQTRRSIARKVAIATAEVPTNAD
jgi:hypothetical protein